MNNIEDRIRIEYQNMKLPDTDIGGSVKARIEAGCKDEGIGGERVGTVRKKVVHPLRFIRMAGVTALFAVIIVCTSATIYAAYNGLTIAQVFSLIWGGGISESIQDTISCEAGIISEKNEFDNLDIRPVRVIGDVRGIYVVFELKTHDERIREALDTGLAAFRDYNLEYENSGSNGSSIYVLDYSDEAWYVALECLGGDDGRLVSDSKRITITMDDLYMYDIIEDGEPYVEDEVENEDRIIEYGSYKAVISYDYVSDDVEFVQDDCTFSVSALSIMTATESEQTYYEMIDKNLTIELKDGCSIDAEFVYGLEYDGKYTAIYSIDQPVDPVEVWGCVVGNKTK